MRIDSETGGMPVDDPVPFARALLLLFVANGAPVVTKKLLGSHFDRPLDGGLILSDGRPLFGSSKTIRGIAASVAFTAMAAIVLGLHWAAGALFAAASIVGDLLSSFIKRRLGLQSQARAVALDQIPEALFPLLVLQEQLELGGLGILVVVLCFALVEIAVSPLLFRLRLRDRPY